MQEMIRACPNSAVYTLFDFLSEQERLEILSGRPLTVSGLNRLPGVRHYYRSLLLACTREIEKFDLSDHDVVLSSAAALAKGVITSPDQTHFAYVHSPARYAWDLTHEYIGGIGGIFGPVKRLIAQEMMHRFRKWDARTPNMVDHFIANSHFIKRRIWKVYRRDAEVIYPPVDVDRFVVADKPREDYFLFASRLVPYKRAPMVAQAFSQRPGLKLRIVGDGPELAAVKAEAGPNIEVLGHVPHDELVRQMQGARGFVFAALEDFGIAPVEAQACGTPVIALGAGGTAETVRPLGQERPTGVWFEEQTVKSLLEAVDVFEANEAVFTPADCRANALSFSSGRFRNELASFISDRIET